MGCSASSSSQIHTPFENQPLERPNEADNTPLLDTKVRVCNGKNTKDTHTKSEDNFHVTHHTRIVLLSNEKETHRSTDSDSIVPIFNHTNHNNNNNNNSRTGLLHPDLPCCESQTTSKTSRNTSSNSANILPNGLKGVLKKGQYYHKDPHVLVNQPIKTVTFMDSVTVLSVY